MSTDKTKLKRLRRLERLRSIAHQTALAEAARAEAALAQVTNLQTRTAALIDAYRLRRDASTGADLRQSQRFVAGLTRIADQTAADLVRAREAADTRAAEAAEAERFFRKSLDLSRRQSALGWELRAAISLGRVWQQCGRVGDARALLAPLVARYGEGLQTRDLIAANELLGALNR